MKRSQSNIMTVYLLFIPTVKMSNFQKSKPIITSYESIFVNI